MDKAKKILQIALLALCCLLVLVLIPVTIVIGHNVRLFLQRSTATMENAREVTTDVKEYVGDQIDILRSPAYQNNFRHSAELGKVATETVIKFNRTIIPNLNGNLTDLHNTQLELKDLLGDGRNLVKTSTTLLANFDKSLNTDLFPSVKTLADSLNVKASDLSDALIEAVWSGQVTLDEAQKLVSNPDIPAAIKELRGSSADFHEATGSFKKGFENFPAMFTAWRKYSEAATTWQKRIYLARLLAIIAGIPGLL